MKIETEEKIAFEDEQLIEQALSPRGLAANAEAVPSGKMRIRAGRAVTAARMQSVELTALTHRVFSELNDWMLKDDASRATVFLIGRRAERLRLAIQQLNARTLPQTLLFVHQLSDALPNGPSTATIQTLLTKLAEDMNKLPLQAVALVDYFSSGRQENQERERSQPAAKQSESFLTWRFFVAIGVALLLIIWLGTRSGYR